MKPDGPTGWLAGLLGLILTGPWLVVAEELKAKGSDWPRRGCSPDRVGGAGILLCHVRLTTCYLLDCSGSGRARMAWKIHHRQFSLQVDAGVLFTAPQAGGHLSDPERLFWAGLMVCLAVQH